MVFKPQIQKRDTEELIIIANSTNDEWQQPAIELAREEFGIHGIVYSDSHPIHLDIV